MEGECVRIATGMVLGLAIVTPAWAADGATQKPAGVDPDVTACQKVTAAEMEQFIGAPATIRETGANLCSWKAGRLTPMRRSCILPERAMAFRPGRNEPISIR